MAFFWTGYLWAMGRRLSFWQQGLDVYTTVQWCAWTVHRRIVCIERRLARCIFPVPTYVGYFWVTLLEYIPRAANACILVLRYQSWRRARDVVYVVGLRGIWRQSIPFKNSTEMSTERFDSNTACSSRGLRGLRFGRFETRLPFAAVRRLPGHIPEDSTFPGPRLTLNSRYVPGRRLLPDSSAVASARTRTPTGVCGYITGRFQVGVCLRP